MFSWMSEEPATGEDMLKWLQSLTPEEREKPIQMHPRSIMRGRWNRVHRMSDEQGMLVLEA